MQLTKYRFGNAVSAFFEMPTETARKILPSHLEPMEVRHGSGVFAITAFHFTESMVGEYDEIVLAVIAPPLVGVGSEFPKSAFYPFLLGTSTEESRAHAIERWHLPHYMKNVQMEFDETDRRIDIRVREGREKILDFHVSRYEWESVDHLYQSFMTDRDHRYKVDIRMAGRFTEHEEESGGLTLHDHPMCEQLDPDTVATYPFRELWMKDGMQTFNELEVLETL